MERRFLFVKEPDTLRRSPGENNTWKFTGLTENTMVLKPAQHLPLVDRNFGYLESI